MTTRVTVPHWLHVQLAAEGTHGREAWECLTCDAPRAPKVEVPTPPPCGFRTRLVP